jgi:hypothetical protein
MNINYYANFREIFLLSGTGAKTGVEFREIHPTWA